MCDCFHLAFPNWHAASGTGAGRRLRAPEPGTEDDSICDEPSQLAEGERPRPQGSSPVEEYPEKYSDSDKELEAEHDPHYKSRSGKKMKKSGLGSIFEKHSTPKMSKLKETPSPETGVIVKTAKDGCAEGLVYGGGGPDGIFIKGVVPESPASKSLKLKEGDQVLSATVYFDNMSYEDAIQILEHAQAYKVKLCLKRNPETKETESATQSDVIHEEEPNGPEMREQRKSKRRSDARISWPKFSSLGRGRKSHFKRSHSSSEADEQRKLELSPTTSDTESPIKSQDALKGKKRHKNKLSLLTKRGRISSSEDQDTETPTPGQLSGDNLQANEVSDTVQAEGLESPSRKEHAVYIAEGVKIQEDLQLEQKDRNVGEPQVAQPQSELVTTESPLKTAADLTVAVESKESATGVKSPGEKKKKKEKSDLKMKILGKDKSHKKDTKAKSSPKRLKTIGASIEKPDMQKPGSDPVQSLESQLKQDDLLIDVDTETTGDRTTLPKREELEIPGMEDMSARSTAKGNGDLKAQCMGLYEENHSETVQLSIDVDSVKEAVSKLPGYKLPKVDTSGVPIPEEITVIDANAQRISVKTPTKVVQATGKEETHLAKFEMTSSSEFSKTTVKLPKITQSYKMTETETHKREDIVIPGKESKQGRGGVSPKKSDKTSKKAKTKTDGFGIKKTDFKIPEIGIDFTRQNVMKEKKEDGATSIPEIQSFTSEMEGKTEGVVSDVKIPEIDCIEYIDSESGSLVKKDGVLADIAISVDGTKLNNNSLSDQRGEGLQFKVPSLDIEVKNDGEGTTPRAKAGPPDTETNLCSVNVAGPQPIMKDEKTDMEFKPPKSEGELEKKGAKFKMPKFGIKKSKMKGTEIDLTLSKDQGSVKLSADKSEAQLSEAAETDVIFPENTDAKDSQEKDTHKSKFKMPKLKISMPKVQKDGEVKICGIDQKATTKDTEDVLLSKITTTELDHKESMISGHNIDIQGPKDIESEVICTKQDLEIELLENITEGELHTIDEGEHIVERDAEESPSKFKIPAYKLPKFAILAHVEEEENVNAGEKVKVTVKRPAANIDATNLGALSVDVKRTEIKRNDKVAVPEDIAGRVPDEVHIKPSDVILTTLESEESLSKFEMPRINIPKFGIASPSVSIEVAGLDEGEKKGKMNIPEKELTVDIKPPETEMEALPIQLKTEHEGKGSKARMISLRSSVPEVETTGIDLSFLKEDIEVIIPEAKAEIALPDVELKQPSADIEMTDADIRMKAKAGSALKFKMPTIQLPKFGIATQSASVEVSDLERSEKNGKAEVNIPEEELTVDIKPPTIEMEAPSIQMKTIESEPEGRGSKFKMPSLGFSVPQVKKRDIDLSLSKKDVAVTIPEAKSEVTLPDVELKQPSADIEMKAPEIQIIAKAQEGSQSKFKMPTFKRPKIGAGAPSASVEVPDPKRVEKIGKVEVNIPEEELTVKIKPPTEHEEKGSKFKMPTLGFSVPQIKKPDINLSLSQKDVEVKVPETQAEVTLPDVELKQRSADVEIKAPDIQITTKTKGGSPSKFKMPTFKRPKFGTGAPSASVEVPDTKRGEKIGKVEVNIPEEELTVDIKPPKIEMEAPSIQMKTTESEPEGRESKFKMPSLGFSVPQVKKPDIDLGLAKDVEVTVPEAKAEITLPDVKLKQPSADIEMEAPDIQITAKAKESSPSKFKMPTFKLPKFGSSTPSTRVEVSGLDKGEKIGKVEVNIPEEELTVDIKPPKIEMEAPAIQMKTIESEHEGKGSKFKMPSLGFGVPLVKKPDIDLSLSKKDVEVKVPEAKAEITLPDVELKQPSVDIEMEAPEIQITAKAKEGSPSKFKMPTFKLPKFGSGAPSASVEVMGSEKSEKMGKVEVNIPEEELTVDIKPPKIEMEVPAIQMKTIENEHEGKGSKFKMPSLGFGVPQVKKPDIDLSLSKKDVEVKVPEAKAEITLPDVELKQSSVDIEMEAPEIQITAKAKEGSPSKFKMPTFKLPKFGSGAPSASVEVMGLDQSEKIGKVEVNIPEEELTVDIMPPTIEMEAPSIQMKTIESEHEGKGSKFKMPSLGFSVPQVRQPDIDLSLSQKDVEVTVPEAKVEVTLPDVELKQPSADIEMKAPDIQITAKAKEGSPLKFKMPTFKLPKFGSGTPSASVEVTGLDKDEKIGKVEVNIPEEELIVDIKPPKIEMEAPSIQMKTMDSEHKGRGSKFEMPSLGFSVPQVRQPDIDSSLSQRYVEVKVPEAKAEITLPDVELKQPSADIGLKDPDIQVTTKTKEGSPLKFKIPTFKLPKFGSGTPSASVEVPDPEKGDKNYVLEVNIPEEELTVEIKPPTIEMEAPSIQLKTIESEHEGKGSKFKMASLGFSVPQVRQPDIDLSLSKKDVEVKVPEAKAEITLPDVELKQPSADIEMKASDIQITAKAKEGSPSKFKLPTFKLPKFGSGTPSASVEVTGLDKGEEIGKAEVDIPEEELTVSIKPPKIEMEAPSIQMKTIESEHQGKGSKFKMPSLGFSVSQVKKPDIDLRLSQKDVEVAIPEAKAEVTLPDVELKQPSADIEMKDSDIQITAKAKEVPPSKFKMPTFKLPKFGSGTPSAGVEVPDLDGGEKFGKVEVNIPEEELTVDIKPPKIEMEAPSIQVKTIETEHEAKGSKFKMPSLGFGFPQVKKPDIDLSLSQKDVEVTIPEATAEVTIPDVEVQQPSADIEIKSPDIQITTKTKEGSPSKFKMPTFKLPKFGSSISGATAEVPHEDNRIKIDGDVDVAVTIPEATVELKVPHVDLKEPAFDLEVNSPDVKESTKKKEGSPFKLKTTLAEIETEVIPPNVKDKEPEETISVLNKPNVEVETKFRRPNWSFPKFSFTRTSVKVPDVNVNIETGADDKSGDAEQESKVPDAEVQATSAAVSTEESSVTELTNTNLKKSKFSLPKFSFSKTCAAEAEVSAELPRVDISLAEGEVKVKEPGINEMEAHQIEIENDGQVRKFQLPKFGIALPKSEGCSEHLNESQENAERISKAKAEINLTKTGGSPLKFEAPTINMPKLDGHTFDAHVEGCDGKNRVEGQECELQGDLTLNIKGASTDIKTDDSKPAISDPELPKTDTQTIGLGSPSKFKLPLFKMPKLSFSRAKPDEEKASVETESKVDQSEIKGETKNEIGSPKMSLTSFGDMLKNIDVEFDVSKSTKEDELPETTKGLQGEIKPSEKQVQPQEQEKITKSDATKSPGKTGGFAFLKFGFFSQSEPAQNADKHEAKGQTSPAEEKMDEEISPTCSIQSSDAFADISSTVTSEHAVLSTSSPTKVTAKYSDSSDVPGFEEIQTQRITSTARTELISVKPKMPEKITILSSGVSSSSEDTLKLESQKIHIITSNIQATPEAQHAKLLTAIEVQPIRGPPLKSEAASWTVEDSQSGTKMFERHLVRKTSSESKETILVTKQITHTSTFESSDPISGEMASSIQRLRESVHSEKMRFFDGTEE